MVAGTQPKEDPSDAAGRRVQAERDALLELIAIFTHDLSNPLQSLTVLCELALDEAPPDTEEHLRSRQCLEAAERMRKLIHGLSGVTRHADGPRSCAEMVRRITDLLSRRFDRHAIELTIDIGPLQKLVPPPQVEPALLNLLLGIVAASAEQRTRRAKASLTGRTGERPSLELVMTGETRDQQNVPCPPTDRHLQRIEHVLEGSGVELIRGSGGAVRLEFDAITG